MRVDVTFFIFEKTFKQIEFFQDRPYTLIAWICPLLKPLVKSAEEYIFFEEDDVSCIYFQQNGTAGYVLPRHKNLLYVNLNRGKYFGVSCIVGSQIENVGFFDIDNWIQYKGSLKR